MGKFKLRNPMDALKNPKEAFQHPLKALPVETAAPGPLGALGQKGKGSGENPLGEVPGANPPVSVTAQEVVQAGMDIRRRELMKKNMRSTIKAGDTGGAMRSKLGAKAVGGNPLVAPQNV